MEWRICILWVEESSLGQIIQLDF